MDDLESEEDIRTAPAAKGVERIGRTPGISGKKRRTMLDALARLGHTNCSGSSLAGPVGLVEHR